MNIDQSRSPSWFNLPLVGAGVSLFAAFLGFWDYVQPSESADMCFDVEEGMTDLEVASMALLGGLISLYAHYRRGARARE
jgi:hypothetical protein